MGLGLVWMWSGCPKTPEPQPPADIPHTFRFAPLSSGPDDASMTSPRISGSASVDGDTTAVSYRVLWRAGDEGFGAVPAIAQTTAPAEPCPDQDFNSLLAVGDSAVLVSHFECVPGATYVTRLDVASDGVLSKTTTAPVSWEAWGGLWFPCAGALSPWGSHLGSEEYEPNAAMSGEMGPEEGDAWANMVAYFGDASRVRPYRYGWATEIVVPAQGEPVAQKHFALGRFSHELSYALPDERTVIESDDGTGVGLFMFIADRAGDLSAGSLYAARFDPPGEASTIPVSWVPLGHADQSSIAAAIDSGVTFADLFERSEPAETSCPDGFRYVHHHYGRECLKLKDPSDKIKDPALLASRLETRRYAAWLGASTELEKAEGITYDAQTGRVYLSLSSIGKRSLEEPGAPADHLGLPPNPCGAVMRFETKGAVLDTAGAPIDSLHVPFAMSTEVSGQELAAPDEAGNRCDPERIANPDNLTFLAGYGQLVIAEDTRRHHNASLWTWSVRDETLTRVVMAPHGGEITGIHWIPNLHGHAYLTLAVQHPWSELPDDDPRPPGLTPADERTFTGYLGPFPALVE